MVEKATRLCDGAFGHLYTYDGELFHVGAVHGDARYVEARRRGGPRTRSSAITWERIVAGEAIVHIVDCRDTEAYRSNPQEREAIERAGVRSLLTVALRKDETLLGILSVYRQEVRPFTEKQIALLQNFAAQAVIAMENARLITETREALEQQTATAEVLGVINSSPGELAPVFDAMLGKATQLCEAAFGILWLCDGERLHAAALHGAPKSYAEVARIPIDPGADNPLGRMLRGERLIVSTDVADEELYRAGDPARRALVDLGGARSVIQAALVKDGKLLGSLTVYRQEVRPFTEKQIALLQNFAAQAVIAMENARLITETREALEQQTATAEVLGVINSSPGELAPVFDAMLEKAARLCDFSQGVLWTHDAGIFRPVAWHGAPPAYAEFLSQGRGFGPMPPDTAPGRLASGRQVAHVNDVDAIQSYGSANVAGRALVELAGARTSLC